MPQNRSTLTFTAISHLFHALIDHPCSFCGPPLPKTLPVPFLIYLQAQQIIALAARLRFCSFSSPITKQEYFHKPFSFRPLAFLQASPLRLSDLASIKSHESLNQATVSLQLENDALTEALHDYYNALEQGGMKKNQLAVSATAVESAKNSLYRDILALKAQTRCTEQVSKKLLQMSFSFLLQQIWKQT